MMVYGIVERVFDFYESKQDYQYSFFTSRGHRDACLSNGAVGFSFNLPIKPEELFTPELVFADPLVAMDEPDPDSLPPNCGCGRCA